MKQTSHWVIAALLLILTNEVAAQSRFQRRKVRVDSVLTAHYYKTPYDTNYVVRPDGKLTLKVRFNQSGDNFHVKGEKDGTNSKADLSTSRKTTISIGASYRGFSAALAINPVKMFGSYKDYEFNLVYYSSRLSMDASYHRSTTLAGDIERGAETERLESGDVNLKMANLAGYYVFNHRRFSYPAAFTQSYVQRRSAGSWLAGISYQGGSIETRDELKERKPDAPDVYVHIGQLGIGGGYGYNWVLGRKWLLHLSMLPTFVIYNGNYMKVRSAEDRREGKDAERKESKHMRFNMIFNERAAIVYNYSPRYFAGITGTINHSIFDDDVVVFRQSKWRVRAFVGLRL